MSIDENGGYRQMAASLPACATRSSDRNLKKHLHTQDNMALKAGLAHLPRQAHHASYAQAPVKTPSAQYSPREAGEEAADSGFGFGDCAGVTIVLGTARVLPGVA